MCSVQYFLFCDVIFVELLLGTDIPSHHADVDKLNATRRYPYFVGRVVAQKKLTQFLVICISRVSHPRQERLKTNNDHLIIMANERTNEQTTAANTDKSSILF